ncbi:hypothetical protein KP509_07G096300 [Ceratopteris richardii]|uniref:Uncharacterized protein n=1 Tax=Ceratopteris richardii TaxID=49495 RepID=A0A8T2UP20_CERRI|nr:hypothetical protein KP509_07G096300 [Ceratopteris richardii]
MVRERTSTSSSGEDDSSTSSSSSEGTSTSFSSSCSSASSSASTSDSVIDARVDDHKRSRKRSLSSRKSRRSSKRESMKKHSRKEHGRLKRCKKSKKYPDVESKEKADKRRRKRRSKRQKVDVQMECATREPQDGKAHPLYDSQNDLKCKEKRNNLLEVTMNAQEQQRALIRHNAELAKARLESGELQRARDEQRRMHRLYGTVDWRANKKLRTEKKKLERSVAAGKRLASLEQREYARMDAFRVAVLFYLSLSWK